MDIFANVSLGLATALAPENLLYCFLGVFLGTLVGVLPGIGSLATISMLFPLTFYLEPTSALIMLAGIWYGGSYGGSIASILLNLPGSTSSAVTCLDGYPMSRQGRGGVALMMTTVASFIGGTLGIVALMIFGPAIASVALKFGPWEYFALMVLGLIAASTISSGSATKGLAMVVVGIMVGTVGLDIYSGVPRFTFGHLALNDGVTIVSLAMGIFGISEIIANIGSKQVGIIDKKSASFRAMIPTKADWQASWAPIFRGTGIGAFVGVLPGVGSSIASFMSYAVEKRVAKDPSRFGHGAIEGIASPEASNNAADQTAFVPTLALGIPGSATMALMIGALMVHGIAPGPTFISSHPDVFWGLVMSFWIGNVLLLILNIPMIGIWVRLLTVPTHLLYPAVMMFVAIGAYSVNGNAFDVWLVLIFGAVGYLLRVLNLPAAPLLLGFVLGPMMEEHFRRAMLVSRGDLLSFFERPISGVVLTMAGLLLVWGIWSAFRDKSTLRNIQNVADDEA